MLQLSTRAIVDHRVLINYFIHLHYSCIQWNKLHKILSVTNHFTSTSQLIFQSIPKNHHRHPTLSLTRGFTRAKNLASRHLQDQHSAFPNPSAAKKISLDACASLHRFPHLKIPATYVRVYIPLQVVGKNFASLPKSPNRERDKRWRE